MKKRRRFLSLVSDPGKPTVEYLTKDPELTLFSLEQCGLVIVQIIPFFFNGVFGANVSFGRHIHDYYCRCRSGDNQEGRIHDACS